jgi:hypothetical protein
MCWTQYKEGQQKDQPEQQQYILYRPAQKCYKVGAVLNGHVVLQHSVLAVVLVLLLPRYAFLRFTEGVST